MSHALEQMKAAGIEVICQSSSSKLPKPCLHGYSASLRKIRGSTFFWEAIFATPRNCPGRNNSHFGLENEGWKMSLVFLVWHPHWFFSFSDMVWRLPLLGMYQELCRASKATHLMPIQPKMQEARERLKKTRSLSVVWGLLAMFRHRKWLLWDLPISVRKSTNIVFWVLIRHCLLIEETRRWNAGWQR